MTLKPIHYFLAGVALTALVAAARFAGGTPLDQTFTYQGQLRNAGKLIDGPVDLRITLWNAETEGMQIGSANTFEAMQLVAGRFACGVNFGGDAFDGSNRWIQVEFRNPAGSDEYLALSPRDKITPAPYALFALSGPSGAWSYDTERGSVSVVNKQVGIGTSTPSAALEVVASGGDDSVKLPPRSVGPSEISLSALSAIRTDQVRGYMPTPGGSPIVPFDKSITVPDDGYVTFDFQLTNYTLPNYSVSGWGTGIAWQFEVDGQVRWTNWTYSPGIKTWGDSFAVTVPVTPGVHRAVLRSSTNLSSGVSGSWEVLYKVVSVFHAGRF